MQNFKLTIEYDGTNYAGWQKQKNALTIQELIEKKLHKIFGHGVKIRGAGRTDSGVHARGQVAHFKVAKSSISTESLKKALNSILPKDIVITKVEKAPLEFHAQYAAKKKRYTYTIFNRSYRCPMRKRFVYFYPFALDVPLMKKGAKILKGKNDFSAFSKISSLKENSVRNIYRLSIKKAGDDVIFTFEADGFLHNMVRILTGTLIELSRGKLTLDTIETVLKSGDRNLAGYTVPASGLCLEKVYYK